MSWTYSGNPATSALDEVRFWIKDTDTTRQLLSNEEILFVIARQAGAQNSSLWAASVCADNISAMFAGEVGVSADGINVDTGSLSKQYAALASSLRAQFHNDGGATGFDLETMNGDVQDDGTVTPLTFGIGVNDNSRAGLQDYGSLRGPGKTWDGTVDYSW
jgi:hypothetical protein